MGLEGLHPRGETLAQEGSGTSWRETNDLRTFHLLIFSSAGCLVNTPIL